MPDYRNKISPKELNWWNKRAVDKTAFIILSDRIVKISRGQYG